VDAVKETGEIMTKITLHTPRYLQDQETTTEYEANDIVHIESAVGDDSKEGTRFWLRDVATKQFCLESAEMVKKLVAENTTDESSPMFVHIGDQVNQNGLMLWWNKSKFETGIIIGFVLGFLSSLLASWAYDKL
jgi:hypothetical protein